MGSILRYVGIAAWAWLSFLGVGLIVIPDEPIICNACGDYSNTVIAVISIVLGLGGLASTLIASATKQVTSS